MVSTPNLYVSGTLLLISFLAFTSQLQFRLVQPGPLSHQTTGIFNSLIAALLISYWRACRTDPGHVPPGWTPAEDASSGVSKRWCRKCEAFKPPRAHHCKECKRCIMKMDHHCPWTVNCVSLRTFPHFLRFLLFAVAAMGQLEYLLFTRLSLLWQNRNWPAYLGPSPLQLAHLFLLVLVNSLTLFALLLLLGRTLWGLGANITTIEGWEIERHHSLLRRARAKGGVLPGPGGVEVKLVRHEFPYDIGIWPNIAQGMGTANVLAWLWPLSPSPSVEQGLDFATNDFNDEGLSWPPPDPDRAPVLRRVVQPSEAELPDFESEQGMRAFRDRQARDRRRWDGHGTDVRRRAGFVEEEEGESSEGSDLEFPAPEKENVLARQAWRNTDGERLQDFGVDVDVDTYDNEEDDVPLSELMARRKAASGGS